LNKGFVVLGGFHKNILKFYVNRKRFKTGCVRYIVGKVVLFFRWLIVGCG